MKQADVNTPEKGDLDRIPLPSLLFRLWKTNADGILHLSWKDGRLSIPWQAGRPCCTVNFFSFRDIRAALDGGPSPLSPVSDSGCGPEEAAGSDAVRSAIRDSSLPTPDIWRRLEESACNHVRASFDREQGSYHFQLKDKPVLEDILFYFDVPSLIRAGVERMTNEEMLTLHIPAEAEYVRCPQTPVPSSFPLMPHQEYILRLVEKNRPTAEIIRLSALNTLDTLRALYLLRSTGFLSLSTGNDVKAVPEVISPAVIHDLVDRLNVFLAFIYKFMSKEIGPFALNVLEKNIHDIQKHLSPLFTDIKLQPDGTIATGSILKKQYTPSGRDTLQNFRRDLNEILAAEILAAKKILGDEKESALIRHLRLI